MPRRLSPALLLGSLLLASASARAEVEWKGDFETGDLSQWDSTNLIKTGDRDNLVFVTDKVADGAKAAQITLRDDIIFEPYNQSRVEVKHNGLHTKNGEESYYAWSFLVPEDAEIRSNIGYWESRVTSKNTMTFWIEPDQDGTVIKFGTGDLGQTLRWTAPLELGKWHRIAIHNVWSQDQAVGKVDVWYDGTQVVTAAMATKRDENELFFQMGLHRSDPSPPVQVIYIDAAREATTQAEILEPLPEPMGMAGSAGMSGTGGGAGAATGGLGGGGAGGAPVSGAGGVSAGGGSGGAPATSAGSAGTAQAGTGATPSITPSSTATDDGGCSVRTGGAAPAGKAWLMLALAAAGLVRRRHGARRVN